MFELADKIKLTLSSLHLTILSLNYQFVQIWNPLLYILIRNLPPLGWRSFWRIFLLLFVFEWFLLGQQVCLHFLLNLNNLPFVVLKLEFGLKVISYLLLVFVVDLLSLVLLANLNLFHDLAFCLMTWRRINIGLRYFTEISWIRCRFIYIVVSNCFHIFIMHVILDFLFHWLDVL